MASLESSTPHVSHQSAETARYGSLPDPPREKRLNTWYHMVSDRKLQGPTPIHVDQDVPRLRNLIRDGVTAAG